MKINSLVFCFDSVTIEAPVIIWSDKQNKTKQNIKDNRKP